jgi:23S rRNA pseudouridine1911/1915/1917 synthase
MIEHIDILTAGPEAAGMRIDMYIAHQRPGISRSRLQKAITAGSVLLNGSATSKKTILKPGDRIELAPMASGSDEVHRPEPQNIDLEILYEDEYLVAINKTAGIVVHPGNGVKDGTLVNALLYHQMRLSGGSAVDRPGIIHRLDKETSGVLLAAKTDASHSAFANLFEQRRIEKTYVGICMGVRPADSSTIDAALGRSRKWRTKQAVRTDGRSAQTDYHLIMHNCGMSVVKLCPHTGRTHQIRLHCRYAGFPIIGDSTYGSDREEVLKLQPMERPFAYSILKCFSRHALHARRIVFEHPFSHAPVCIEAPFPGDFTDALAIFGCDLTL